MKEAEKINNRFVTTALLIIPVVIISLLPLFPIENTPVLLLLVGRFHPMLLHFPIVLIFMVLLFEVIGYFGLIDDVSLINRIILITSCLSTFVVVLAGYFLFASGEYTGDIMASHLQGGIASGILIFLTCILFFQRDNSASLKKLYLVVLLITNGAVVFTSHMGGSLTHGENYLSEYLNELFLPVKIVDKPKEELLVYGDLIQPFIESRCVSCHNQHKKKGDYLMTSYSHLIKGGESGQAAIVAGKSADSEIVKRIELPAGHDDRMPPEGKKPLNQKELDILKLWIENGASEELKVGDIGEQQFAQVTNEYLPKLKKLVKRQAIGKAEKEKLKQELKEISNKYQVNIEEDPGSNGQYFSLALRFPPSPFTDKDLQELEPYFPVFSKVSLVASDITDDALYFIGQMSNLRKLYLQKTALNGSGLIFLKNLESLEEINLSYTKIDDANALGLIQHSALKTIYIHNNKLSPEVVEALRKNQPEKKFLLEEGPYN
ncbi:MAG: cytochrome C [Cyclobacteriaceae bacterium]